MDFSAFKKEIQTHFTCIWAKPAIKQMGGKKIKDFQTEAPLINQTKLTAELSNSFCSFTSRGERERDTHTAGTSEHKTEDTLRTC